ncbi:MAG: topoisomerase-like zinc finger-containing protein [Verrucomicrobiales bacterium]|nr:topoisomerase-like zinc finger-containing protein [Verrucomicrobiales bacterium]
MARSRGNTVELAITQLVILLLGAGAVFFGLRRASVVPFILAIFFLCSILAVLKLLKPAHASRKSTTGNGTIAQPQIVPEVRAPAKKRSISDQLQALDWYQFERLLAAIYKEKGNEVERLGGAKPDGGIDFILRMGLIELPVQCKHWKSWTVGVKEVREFLGAIKDAGLESGRLIALKDFSRDARALAQRHNVQLVDGKDLVKLMSEVNWENNPAIQSILNETTKICPQCDAEMVLRTVERGRRAGERFWGCSQFPKCEGALPLEMPLKA